MKRRNFVGIRQALASEWQGIYERNWEWNEMGRNL